MEEVTRVKMQMMRTGRKNLAQQFKLPPLTNTIYLVLPEISTNYPAGTSLVSDFDLTNFTSPTHATTYLTMTAGEIPVG